MGRVEYGTDGYPYKLSMSTGIDNTDGFKYPVVARAYKDDMVVREKFFTRADMVAMLIELQLEITEKSYYDTTIIGNYEDEVRIGLVELDDVNDIIQQKINALKGEV